MITRLLLLLILFTYLNTQAQTIKFDSVNPNLEHGILPYYNFGKGVGITSPDSIFQLNIRFRMQNRITYSDFEDKDESLNGEIKRLRLRLDGYVGNPKFLYTIQLSFSPGDVGEIHDGDNINIIRDAVMSYRPNKNWIFSLGQTKLPGNRQRLNSSGALQLTDRSINNAKFTIDRDFGIQIHNTNEYEDKFSYNFRGAISMGEGRNYTKQKDTGIALTGKAEIYPFGAFNRGTFFEGDLKREPKPKLMLSTAFQQNNDALRERGQIGANLFEARTLKSTFVDMMFKYNGWSLMSAYMNRRTKNPITINPNDVNDIRYVFVGEGFDVQGSYLFRNNYELIGRFTNQWVDKEIRPYEPNTQQWSIGLTKYIWEHAFKLQSELTYETQEFFNTTKKNNWYVRFQIEIGI